MEKQFNRSWTRFHDDPRTILLNQVPEVDYPGGLADLIELCRDRPPEVRLRAAGSHWALSEAAISDHSFIESHDPQELVPAMDRTLLDVVPGCLHHDVLESMRSEAWPSRHGALIHVESGKRIYQLYAELDQKDDGSNPATLAGRLGPHFAGPWGLETLGNSGGQTIVGAFSTGTHGGDFDRGAVADLVVAVHLVADGGRHYWIERVDHERYFPQLTDDAALTNFYGAAEVLGGPGNFHIIRDNQILDAVLVSVGRFGVIYSAVLRAVLQYSLWERRRMHLWQDIRTQISASSPGNPGLFQDKIVQKPDANQRFLQVAVCLTPHLNFMRNLAGVTKRWEIPVEMGPAGHAERVGDRDGGPNECPNFTKAGKSHAFTPNPDHPEQAGDPGMLEKACTSASFLSGLISTAIHEIEAFVESHGVAVGAGVAAVAAAGGGGLLGLLGPLALAALTLKELLDALGADDRLGEAMEKIKNKLLDPNEPDPAKRAAGLFAWQLIAYAALIAFEIEQEMHGKACLGYASLRFTGPTRALIGPQQWGRTCAVEVSGLKDVSGSEEMVEFASKLALNPNMGAILHWGQYNPSTRPQVEMRFGPKLVTWRAALAQFNGDGGFSSAFSRRAGLEP